MIACPTALPDVKRIHRRDAESTEKTKSGQR